MLSTFSVSWSRARFSVYAWLGGHRNMNNRPQSNGVAPRSGVQGGMERLPGGEFLMGSEDFYPEGAPVHGRRQSYRPICPKRALQATSRCASRLAITPGGSTASALT